METKQRSPEMENLLTISKELSKIFQREKTDESLENFKEAERQRYRQYYNENIEKERNRNKKDRSRLKELNEKLKKEKKMR